MRLTEFWRRMDEVFGPSYAASWAADFSLPELGGATVTEALRHGVAAKEVWRVVCLNVEVPAHLA